MSKANERQVGGTHYKGAQCPHCKSSLEHWDLAWLFRWDNFQYAITKYVMRWREKHGLADLEKAAHCLEKYIEVVKAENSDIDMPGSVVKRQPFADLCDHMLDADGQCKRCGGWLPVGAGYVDQDR